MHGGVGKKDPVVRWRIVGRRLIFSLMSIDMGNGSGQRSPQMSGLHDGDQVSGTDVMERDVARAGGGGAVGSGSGEWSRGEQVWHA